MDCATSRKDSNPLSHEASTAFVDPVYDGWCGTALAEYLFGDVRHPNTHAEWLSFFEHLVAAYDADREATAAAVEVNDKNGRQYTMVPSGAAIAQKVTPEVRQFIQERIDAGDPSGVIRAEVEAKFGVEVSSSHMAHLRRRMKATTL